MFSENFRTYVKKNEPGIFTKTRNWFNKLFVLEKLDNPFGYILFVIATCFFSYSIGTAGLTFGGILIALILGVPIITTSLLNIKFGILFVTVFSFFVMALNRLIPYDIPFGVVVDISLGVMLFGMFIKQLKEKDWSFAKNPISYILFIWFAYNLLMFVNPIAPSRLAWFYTVRGTAGYIVFFFLMLYAIDSVKYISTIIKLLILLTLLVALYGLYQEYFGLPPWDMAYLYAEPRRYALFVNWGHLRIFSFLSDPAILGVLTGYISLFCIILMVGPFNVFKKIILAVSALIMIMCMMFSGTRTAYVIHPSGLLLFTLLTYKRNYIIAGLAFFMVFVFMIFMPTGNPIIIRFQSAFRPTQDASFQVRLQNQRFIQPYIRSHPIGGGLGTTGDFGNRFSPNTMLAHFPPDSGYVRDAVEMGWLGLLLHLIVLFVIFKTGIRNYFLTKDPKIRIFYLAFLCMLFSITVANYPQITITQIPTALIFYIICAILVRLKDFDQHSIKKID